MNGGASGFLCQTPHFLLVTWAQGTQPWTGSLQRVNSLPDLGQSSWTEAREAALPCPPVGWAEPPGAQKQEEWPGPQKPPPTLSLPELQPLFVLPHGDQRVRPGSQIPEDRDFSITNRGLLWGKGAACLPDTGWGQGTVGRSSLRSGGCRLAGPQGLSTSLLFPPRPSEQRLWVSVLPEPRPKLAQGWGRGGDSRSECEVSVCDLRCCMWTLNCTCSF